MVVDLEGADIDGPDRLGLAGLRDRLAPTALQVLATGKILFGLGVVENAREQTALIKALFTAEGLVDFDGEYYSLKQAPFAPRCVQVPHVPIMVGGTGEKRTLKTLAMYGDIMNVIAGPEEVKRLGEVLDRHCEAVGRDPAEIRRTAHVAMRIENDEARASRLRGDRDWAMIGPRSSSAVT